MVAAATELWHPVWCDGGVGPCGNHLSAPMFVPVSGDPPHCPPPGLEVPRLEIAAAITRTGTPGVSLGIYDYVSQRWVYAIARSHEATWASDAVLAQRQVAESQ
jgi:hypothetical protein